jgi:hypothetical protein
VLQLPLETDIASEDRPLTSPKTVARVFRLAEGDLAVPRPLSAPTLRWKFKTETLRTPSGEQRDCPSRIPRRLATSQFDSTLKYSVSPFRGRLERQVEGQRLAGGVEHLARGSGRKVSTHTVKCTGSLHGPPRKDVEELSSGDTSFRQVLSVTFITLHRVLSGAFVYKVPALSRWIRNFVGRGPFYRDRSLT